MHALGRLVILVTDYDTAIAFYQDKLGMEVFVDMAVGAQRYVHLRLPEQPSVGVWLLQAQTQRGATEWATRPAASRWACSTPATRAAITRASPRKACVSRASPSRRRRGVRAFHRSVRQRIRTRATEVSRAAHAKEPAMDLQLEGKRVLITGASKGIGLAAALAFAREGASPTLVGRDPAALRAAADLRPDRHARRLRGAGPGTRRRAAGTASPGRPRRHPGQCRRRARRRTGSGGRRTLARGLGTEGARLYPAGAPVLPVDARGRRRRDRQRDRHGRLGAARRLYLRRRGQCLADRLHPRAGRRGSAPRRARLRPESLAHAHRPRTHPGAPARRRAGAMHRAGRKRCRACRSAA